MTKSKILLDLSRHCIETEIKRQHNRAVSGYFAPEADKAALEQVIETTRLALEHLDFSRLRGDYPPLAGKKRGHAVWLERQPGRLLVVLDSRPVAAIPVTT